MTEPRTLDDLLALATIVMNGGRLNKTELVGFMRDLLAVIPEIATVANLPAAEETVPTGYFDTSGGFLDPSSVRCQVIPDQVFVPNVCGYYSPRQAAALAVAIYRASLEAAALAVKTPEETKATDARLRALLPYRDPT